MKYLKLFAYLPALFIFSMVSPVFGSNWVACEMDNYGIHYYNKEKIKYKTKDIIEVTTRLIYFDGGREIYILKKKHNVALLAQGYDNLSETRCIYEIDCRNEMSRFLSMTDYDENGRILSKIPKKSNWHYIKPSSMKDALRKTVCK